MQCDAISGNLNKAACFWDHRFGAFGPCVQDVWWVTYTNTETDTQLHLYATHNYHNHPGMWCHRVWQIGKKVSGKPAASIFSVTPNWCSSYVLPWELQTFHHLHYLSQHVANLSIPLGVTARNFFLWDNIHQMQKLQMRGANISVHHILYGIQRDYFTVPLPMGWYFTNTKDVSKSQVP